jgi:ribonuclease HI
MHDWITNILATRDKDCIEQITAIIYNLWNARNQLVFQERQLPQEEISKRALTQLHEYQKLSASKLASRRVHANGAGSHDTSWSPPPRDSLKINVDAHRSGDGRWFSGLVLRRSDGSVVGAATHEHTSSDEPAFGEAMGLNDAISMAENLRLSRVIFEMDSLIVVNAVKKEATIRRNGGKIAQRCVNFLKQNPNSSIRWTRRDNNRAAHELANWAVRQPNYNWINSTPSCILPHIHNDMDCIFSKKKKN